MMRTLSRPDTRDTMSLPYQDLPWLDLGRASSRVPTLSFTVDGVPAEKVAAHLADRRIATVASTRGSSRLLDSLGVSDEGGAVSIGLAPYTTSFEVDQLVRELRNL